MTSDVKGATTAFSRAAAASLAAVTARNPAHGPAAGVAAAIPMSGVRADRDFMLIGGMVWLLVVLMIVPEGLDYGSLTATEAPRAGRMISRLLWLALLGFGLVVIFWRSASAWLLARWLNPFLLAFVVLAVASVTWSLEPAVTARRMIRVVTFMVAAMAFVLIGWHAQRFQSVLRPIITAALLGSIIFGLGWPDLAIHPETSGFIAGSWHGLANHKNSLGGIASIGLIFWYHAWLSREASALPVLVGGALAIACLVLSRSSTSLIVTVFTLLFLTMLMRSPPALRRHLPWLVSMFIAALVVYALVLLQILPGLYTLLSPIGEITGKDMTFTGRTNIWDIMTEHIGLHPVLGTGYGAYWTGIEQGTPSFDFILRLNFYPASAHNGYLDVLNELGAVGLVVLLGYLASFVAQSLRLFQVERDQASLYLALFLQQAITNLAESRWFSPLSIDFVIMTLATAALARALLGHHLRLHQEAARQASHRSHGSHGDFLRSDFLRSDFLRSDSLRSPARAPTSLLQ